MLTMPYTAFRNNMKATISELHDDADVMLVTNRDPDDNVVDMSQDDNESLMETLRILSNPDLHRRVLSSNEPSKPRRKSMASSRPVPVIRHKVDPFSAHAPCVLCERGP